MPPTLKNYLKKGKDMAYEIGDEVYWTDPDEGIGSGWGKVADRHGRKGKHQIYILKMRDGGEVECFRHELS